VSVKRCLAAAALGSLLAASPAPAAEEDLARHVDPMIGTFAPGFIFPGAAVPFGMVQNSPDTRGEFAYSGYLYSDPAIQAFSLVHLSGPGVKKGGDIPVMPVVGEASDDPAETQSTFSHTSEQAEPGYYRVFLDQPATTVELTASTRAAMQRYTFPPAGAPKLVFDVGRSVEGTHEGELAIAGDDEVSGRAKGRYPVFFVARFSRKFDSSGRFEGGGGWVGWDEPGEVTVRVGISFVDVDGARRNLEAEAPNFDFDRMRREARAAWNRELGRVVVSGGTADAMRTFYTALYRAQLHPNVFTDVDGRYRGMDDGIHAARGRTQYSNFSSWDLYKSENQLLALIQPARYREMLLSLLADHREGGKVPRWKEQSIDAAHMSGDPAIPMIAEGVCRGEVAGDDAFALYEASAALAGHRDAALAKLGWLPNRPGTTLEYGVADFALALMAHKLGKRKEARALAERSLYYRNVLDPETRWIRPRDESGAWKEPFDPTEDAGFQEGTSWQYSWLAMHDARGLYERMGGDSVVRDRLDHMFSLPPEAQNRLTVFGIVYRTDQWAPGNEHDLQVPWMYHFAGAPWRAAAELDEVRILYRPTVDGLPGNDDLGGLSSWHVLSALGLGGLVPGAPYYALGSPQFERAEIAAPGGKLVIESPGTGPYVTEASLDGKPLPRAWVYEREIRNGATLRLARAEEPDEEWGAPAAARPPSYSDSALTRFGCGDGRRPKIRLSVEPKRVRAGRRTRVRVTTSLREAGRSIPIAHATIRVAGRRARTGARGRASLRLRVGKPGRYRVRATKNGYRAARAFLRKAR
jgi:predicted alpha-1,2-mannosidase